MKVTSRLKFSFKGNRNYVQGPDIFDAVIRVLIKEFSQSDITRVKYAAHNMLYTNADLIITDEFEQAEYPALNSVVTFKYADIKYYAIVVSNTLPILISTPYSEETVRTKSVIEGERVTFQNELTDSITEIIVSMNKYFLQKTVTKGGKWIVTKFDYTNLADISDVSQKVLSLKLTNNFNNLLTKSLILVDGNIVGNIYFSLI